MHDLFHISPVWHDPAPGLKRASLLLGFVLALESAGMAVRAQVPVDPLALTGIMRGVEAAVLLALGPWSMRGEGDPRAALQGLVLALAVSFAGLAAVGVWTILFNAPPPGLFPSRLDPETAWIPFLFTTSLASPLTEELVFRGILYRGLRERWNAIPAMLVVSGIFAGLHVLFGGQALFPFVGSLLFCAGYEVTKHISAPVLLHVFGNGILIAAPSLGLFQAG